MRKVKKGEYLPDPTLEERISLCISHLKLSVQYKGPWYGVVDFRKHYSGYLHDLPHVAKLRTELMGLMDINKIIERLNQFLDQYSSMSAT